MADILSFDVSEFEVLETFKYEEEVQRPENLRFFTLEEQLLDYFDARMPPGKPTRFQLQKLEREQDRVKDAYLASVEDVDGEYAVRRLRRARMPPWVHPLADKFETVAYDYARDWVPLFSKEQKSAPGYYTRMLKALPFPYETAPTENPRIESRTYARTADGGDVSALGKFETTHTKLHEDGSIEIVTGGDPHTIDGIRIQGYSMDARTLELPNPLPGHPFLASGEASTLITKEAFSEVFPSVAAVLEHGVPTTQHPFTEGMKYLKVYDVRLNEIPWSVWKQRFPPVDVVLEPPPPVSVAFPAPPETQAPHEMLQTIYASPWKAGIHPRHWMSRQEDAGTLVVRMLLSRTNEAGLLNVKPLGEMLEPQFPEADPVECLQTDTFETFMNGGLYRGNKCIPVAAIHNEQAALIDDILKTHQALLRSYRFIPATLSIPKYDPAVGKEASELRGNLLTLLKDPERTEEDKVDALGALLKDILPTNRVFLDANGGFLLCQHTLAVLKGEMAKNLQMFYRDWTSTDQGFQVCKFCGEQVGTVYTTQDEFDGNGRLLVSQGVLDDPSFHGDSQIDSFANSLKKLQHVFQLKSAMDAVFYLVLSLLQVLPEERQLIPVLHVVRRMSAGFNAVATKKGFGADIRNKMDGIFGFAGAVALLQTHRPFLIPRRSFGSRPLVLSGFPRDTQDTKTKGILDTLLFLLKGMFEAFPGSFEGPIVQFVRQVVGKPGSLKADAEKYLKDIAENKLAAQFEEARERYNAAPATQPALSTKTIPLLTLDKTEYAPTETLLQQPTNPLCNSVQPTTVLRAKQGPSVRQVSAKPWAPMPPSPQAVSVDVSDGPVVALQTVSEQDVRASLKLKFPALKLPSLQKFVNESNDGIALLTLLQRLVDILRTFLRGDMARLRETIVRLDTRVDPSLLRDTARGLIYRILHDIARHEDIANVEHLLQTAVRRDVVLRMVLLRRDEAKRVQQSLQATERETFKQRMRRMPDAEREVTKQLLDIGLAGFIITNEDRRLFAKEQEAKDQDQETLERLADMDENIPEEGHNGTREEEDGAAPVGENGRALETDFGDYGDRADRVRGDYGDDSRYDFDEGDGV